MSSPGKARPRRRWLIAVIGLAVAAGTGWTACHKRSPTTGDPAVDASVPVLLDFGMDICMECKETRALIDSLAPSYQERLQIRFLDVREDANEALATQYGVSIIPLLVLLDASGREVWRHEGRPTEAVLRERLDAVTGAGERAESATCSEATEVCSP